MKITVETRKPTKTSSYTHRAKCECGYKTNWHFQGHVNTLVERHVCEN